MYRTLARETARAIARGGKRARTSAAHERWRPGVVTPGRPVPAHIGRPPYASSGIPAAPVTYIELHSEESIPYMRAAGQLSRSALDYACSLARAGVTTDEIDGQVSARASPCVVDALRARGISIDQDDHAP